MAWLSCDDELPNRPARILVTGTSGSGKSTLARHLAAVLELRYVEFDALHHGTNWTPRPEFLDEVKRFVAGERWSQNGSTPPSVSYSQSAPIS